MWIFKSNQFLWLKCNSNRTYTHPVTILYYKADGFQNISSTESLKISYTWTNQPLSHISYIGTDQPPITFFKTCLSRQSRFVVFIYALLPIRLPLLISWCLIALANRVFWFLLNLDIIIFKTNLARSSSLWNWEQDMSQNMTSMI